MRDFMNVVRVSGNSFFHGDTMRYRCRAGVQPARSPPMITCQADGKWDGDIACGGKHMTVKRQANMLFEAINVHYFVNNWHE